MGKGNLGTRRPGGRPPGHGGVPSAVAAGLLGVLLSQVMLASTASAHAAGSAYPAEWDRLLLIVLVLGSIVAAIVFSIMGLALWRYREKSPYPREEPATHNFKLEAVWTTIPVILVTVVIVLSLNVLKTTEDLPEDAIHIDVIARQFEWEFRYPDNTSTMNEMWVEEGQTVVFEVRSEDVIHSFSLPAFRLKVDAFPNYVDDAYIIAEPEGDYDIYCAEFCGDVHSSMLATLHIYPKGSSDKPYGPPPGEVPPPPRQEEVTIDLELREDGGPGGARPWSITPSRVDLPFDAKVTLRVWNNGTENHSLFLSPPYGRLIETIPPGEARSLNFTSDKPTAGIVAYCTEDDHRQLGLSVLLVVEPEPAGDGTVVEGISFPFVHTLYGLALLMLGMTLFAAVRPPSKRPPAAGQLDRGKGDPPSVDAGGSGNDDGNGEVVGGPGGTGDEGGGDP